MNQKKNEQLKASKRRKIINIRAEINKIRNRKTIRKNFKVDLCKDQQNWQNATSYIDNDKEKTDY